jgi:hypothetical protein
VALSKRRVGRDPSVWPRAIQALSLLRSSQTTAMPSLPPSSQLPCEPTFVNRRPSRAAVRCPWTTCKASRREATRSSRCASAAWRTSAAIATGPSPRTGAPDGARERDPVARVDEQAQVGEQVAHPGVVGERPRPEDPVGHAREEQLLLSPNASSPNRPKRPTSRSSRTGRRPGQRRPSPRDRRRWGASVTPGRALFKRPSKGKSRGRPASPRRLLFDTSSARAQTQPNAGYPRRPRSRTLSPAQIAAKTSRSHPAAPKTSPQQPICGPARAVRDRSHPEKSPQDP